MVLFKPNVLNLDRTNGRTWLNREPKTYMDWVDKNRGCLYFTIKISFLKGICLLNQYNCYKLSF